MRNLALLFLVSCANASHLSVAVEPLLGTASIAEYGAVPDDSVDDLAAIQLALNSGATDVLIPCGVWLASRTVRIPAGVTLRGETRECAVLRQMPGAGPSVRLLQPGPGQSSPPPTVGVVIRDLTLDGDKAHQSVDEHRSGVFASNAPGLRIEHVTSCNFTGDGFYLYFHTDAAVVTDVLACDNDRDGIVFGGNTTGGLVTGSTFRGNRAQQIDTEGGAVANLTVTGNVVDGTVSNDYAFTIAGKGPLERSSGWLVANNTITGGVSLTWVDNTLVTGNTISNSTTKPAVTLWRTTNHISLSANHITSANASQVSNSVVYIGGTGTGSATTGYVGQGNVLIGAGHPSMFGYRIEGAISVELRDEQIVGPGVAGTGAGIYLRATNVVEDFQSARLWHNAVRNWGTVGVAVHGNSTARLNTLDVAYNTFDDSSGTMLTAMSLDRDRSHAAKDIRVVGNALAGGCVTALASVPGGAATAWGDRWMLP